MNSQFNPYASYLPNPFEFKPASYISNISSSPETESSDTFSTNIACVKLPPITPNSQFNMSLPSLEEAINGKVLKSKDDKQFISLFNEQIQKRPRRKYSEIERFYKCTYYNCNKSYGALNHLNAHIIAQSHGPKKRAYEYRK